jgi:hypothetical protein
MRVWSMLDRSTPASAVRVDRATRWGNPFVIGEDGDRAEVIAKYRGWLWGQMCSTPGFVESMVAELDGRDLKCWCSPEPCHADVLISALTWVRGQEGK